MKKNLVCLFSKNNYSRYEFDIMRDEKDNHIYKKAQDGINKGITDIYTMTDFECDFNNNREWVSAENYYIIFVNVDDTEVEQWEK